MSNQLAPIALSTYSRLNHLQQTVSALQNNFLAKESELFIFSDGPKKGDEAKVYAVREYLKSINGFKKIHIFERTENNRIKNNRGGMRDVLEEFNKIILIEEDIVTTPNFLKFMNDGLNEYENEKKVFSISGWSPNFYGKLKLSESSTFFIPRISTWGLGIWKDRFDKIRSFDHKDYIALLNNKQAMKRINEHIGRNVLPMMYADANGLIDALDVKGFYHQALEGDMTLYPYISLVKNIGLDGTGEHCGLNMKDINGTLNTNFDCNYQFPSEINVDDEVAIAITNTFKQKLSVESLLINLMIKLNIYKDMRPILKKIQIKFRAFRNA